MKNKTNYLLITIALFTIIVVSFKFTDLDNSIKRLVIVFSSQRNSDQYIKKLIELDYPKVNDNDISDFERVNMLRQWVATYVDWGSESTRIDHHTLDKKSLKEVYEYFQNDLGTVECGGATQILMRIYNLYGYHAYRYDSGTPTSFNHIINIVRINHKEKEILSIQDPSYDVTYLTKNGEPFDFYQFLIDLKSKNIENIYVLEGNAKKRDYICSLNDKCLVNKNYQISLNNKTSKYLYRPSRWRVYQNLKDRIYLDFKYIHTLTEWNSKYETKLIQSILN